MKYLFLLLLLSLSLEVLAQDSLFKSSVQEIMEMEVVAQETEIVSASKKAEKLFNSALSVSVITRDQIEKAGCLSIPEALRLANGVIVRETTAGNYDIHLLGLNNVKPFKAQFVLTESPNILVMIDSRPVYNYFQGGTFWETLPIDIIDIESIEIVRGASSALYGANAVTGVINLITSSKAKNNVQARTNIQYGSENSKIFQTHISGRLGSRFSVGASFNYQYRQRLFDRYYRFSVNRYVPLDSLTFLGASPTRYRYPERSLALDRTGTNFWASYTSNKGFNSQIKAGWQTSTAQKMYVDNVTTPLTTNLSNTSYIDWTSQMGGFSAQVAYQTGRQKVQGVTGWLYDFATIFANIEYEWQRKNWSVRTGLNYQEANYDDKPAATEFGITRAFLGGNMRILHSFAAFARAEYTWKNLKAIAALRAEKYNFPDKTYFPYQLALTYQPNENWLFRITNSQANQGAFMLDNFYNHTAGVKIVGNTNLNLANLQITEIGFRKKIGKSVEIDVELFSQEISNLAGVKQPLVGRDNMISNYDIKAQQQGINGSVSYQFAQKFSVKLGLSYQKTMLKDFPNSPDYTKSTELENKATPAFYGNLTLNWLITSKINLNTNIYYMGEQEITGINGNINITQKNLATPAFAVFNANVSYAIRNNFKVFVNARNFNWGSKKQLFLVDDILPEILLGARFDL
ncbi:MAG: hypothetical protein EAZ97_06280 [Bacteroidetes bacterium]|nr:MAG: hypothetical protein EAZ97_06280 [Bacteroidota bacterium]